MAVTWATVDDVTDALGVPTTDTAHLDACVAAANAFAYRRRLQAGYVDDETVAPGDDAHLGVVTYAVALFRERGTVDSYASFDAYAAGAVPQSTFGQVLRLLGVPRPAVDRPYTDDELAARRVARRLARMAR
jgi:hypothetical protein